MTDATPPDWRQARIARFAHCRATDPSDHPMVAVVLDAIRQPSPAIAALIAQVRAAPSKAERDRLKEGLPGITFAADLHHRRGGTPLEDKLIAWSGLAAMDLDGVADPAALQQQLRTDPFVAAAFLSPSGLGLKVLVAIADPARFADCWRAAASYMLACYGIAVDPAPKGVASLCYASADPDLHIAAGLVEAFQPLAAEPPRTVDPPQTDPAIQRPGDAFNQAGDIADLLHRHGWTLLRDGANQHWCRPGKTAGVSATLKDRVFYVFSSSAAPFEPNHGYSPFAVYTLLNHGGDYAAAAGMLRRSMPAEIATACPLPTAVPAPAPAATPVTAPPRSAIVVRTHADRRRDRFTPPPMLIAGVLPLGGLGAIVAMPNSGKTLVATTLARSVAAGEPFLGRPVEAGAVIYACPDSPASTERRMLAIPDAAADEIYTICDLPPLPGSIADLRTVVTDISTTTPVRLVVLDTWDSAREHAADGWAGQDALIEGLMRELRSMASELRLAVVVVHHATRNDHGRARGSVVFDARADWIAIAEGSGAGEGSTISLRTIKCRDGERGDLGAFRIVRQDVGGEPVPTLVPLTAGDPVPAATPDPGDRSLVLLRYLATHPGQPTVRSLADALDFSGTGAVSRALDALRAAGLIEPDGYEPTPAGIARVDADLLDGWEATGGGTGPARDEADLAPAAVTSGAVTPGYAVPAAFPLSQTDVTGRRDSVGQTVKTSCPSGTGVSGTPANVPCPASHSPYRGVDAGQRDTGALVTPGQGTGERGSAGSAWDRALRIARSEPGISVRALRIQARCGCRIAVGVLRAVRGQEPAP